MNSLNLQHAAKESLIFLNTCNKIYIAIENKFIYRL